MGYRIRQVGCSFFVAADHKSKALKACKPVHGGWVHADDTASCRTLEELLEAWGYEPNTDEDGNITAVQFSSEKLGDEFELWKALAPFVKPGSFIDISGEDGTGWRWAFDGKTCKEKTAKISYED